MFITKVKNAVTRPSFIFSILFSIGISFLLRYAIFHLFGVDVIYDIFNFLFALHLFILAIVREIIKTLFEHIEFDKHILNMMPAGGGNNIGGTTSSGTGSSTISGGGQSSTTNPGASTGQGTTANPGVSTGQGTTANPGAGPLPRPPRRSFFDTVLNSAGDNTSNSTAGSGTTGETINTGGGTNVHSTGQSSRSSDTVVSSTSVTDNTASTSTVQNVTANTVVGNNLQGATNNLQGATNNINFRVYYSTWSQHDIYTMNNIAEGIHNIKSSKYSIQPLGKKLAQHLILCNQRDPDTKEYFPHNTLEDYVLKKLRTIQDGRYNMGNNKRMALGCKKFTDFLENSR
jgi:hypothetical protein